MMRRLKEMKRLERAQEKAGKKEQRKKEKADAQAARREGGEDPDIAGIVPGPQAPLE
jgi:hypothetical protein